MDDTIKMCFDRNAHINKRNINRTRLLNIYEAIEHITQ